MEKCVFSVGRRILAAGVHPSICVGEAAVRCDTDASGAFAVSRSTASLGAFAAGVPALLDLLDERAGAGAAEFREQLPPWGLGPGPIGGAGKASPPTVSSSY